MRMELDSLSDKQKKSLLYMNKAGNQNSTYRTII